ncbi:hypothetical protein G7046_g1548 [Stylonectria norvegica]|nr:hypothetical protein G7046_g1548 [Stylonectria norvegica]
MLFQFSHLAAQTMTSFSREPRESSRTPRRDSLSQKASRQRPRLLRSSATEPSITTSNAIRGSLACSSSPQKATDLLNRVAVYAPPSGELEHSSAPMPVPRQVDAIVICREGHEQSPPGSQEIVLIDSPSGMYTPSPRSLAVELRTDSEPPGYYFSFPSFDNWTGDKQEVEKDTDD